LLSAQPKVYETGDCTTGLNKKLEGKRRRIWTKRERGAQGARTAKTFKNSNGGIHP